METLGHSQISLTMKTYATSFLPFSAKRQTGWRPSSLAAPDDCPIRPNPSK
jgi:hypothetical protein